MSLRSCCCSINTLIAIAALGIFAGLLAGVWFAGQYHNYSASVWGFISSILALLVMLLHIKRKRGTIQGWARYLFGFMVLGIIMQLIAFAAFVTYVVLAIVMSIPFEQFYGENYWITIVWVWMTWKWSFGLFWFSRKYDRLIKGEGMGGVKDVIAEGGIPGVINVSPDGESRE